MPLALTLNTNEVKDSAGAEVEFTRITNSGRSVEYAKVSETPNLPYRLSISHEEVGTGTAMRRRSKVRFDKSVAGVSGTTRKCSAYVVVDAPVGDISTDADVKNVIANVMSFLATTGAATTVLFDCTGNGAASLVSGTL